jgi:hypothetical protein
MGLPNGYSNLRQGLFFMEVSTMSYPNIFHLSAKSPKSLKTLIVLLFAGLFALAGSAEAAQNVTIRWAQPSSGDPVSAYRLYQDNLLLCETLDPAARALTCPAVLEGKSVFTVVAVYGDGGAVLPPVNNPPSGQDLAVTLDEDGAVASFLRASDPDNDPLTYGILTGPTSGAVVLTDPLTGAYRYTPNKDFSGPDSFTYLANDGSVDSAPAAVSLTIRPVNDAPVAAAGADQSVAEGQSASLDATGSTDIDDGIDAYSWTQLSGPTAILSDSGASRTTVLAPEVGAGGAVLTYQLTVTDLGGLRSQDTMAIYVTDVVVIGNQVPGAAAIVTSVEEEGEVYGRLAGSDADGDALTYTITKAPAGGLVELLDSTTGEFRYSPARDVTGTDSFLYTVSDGKDVSGSAAVTINILPVNDAPVANAGPDRVVNEGETVILDATNSYDIDDELLNYAWVQLDGPTVSLSDPNAIQPRFAAIDVGLDSVTLTFQLTVTDAQGLEATDISSVNVVWVNQPPVAAAGEDQSVFEGDTVVLDASGSVDGDDGIASYAWVQLSGPAMRLSDSTAMQPSFSAPDVGMAGASMTYAVTVTDFGGLYTKDTVIVNIVWVNTPPVADAGVDQSVAAGDIVTLDGSRSIDKDDGIATIQWTQKSGGPVTLSDPIALQPVFDAPADILAPVSLAFELLVTDYSGLQHTDSCTVEVLPLQPVVVGDVDGDGDRDNQDMLLLKGAVGTCVGDTGYLESADLDGDSCVTKKDAWLWHKI